MLDEVQNTGTLDELIKYGNTSEIIIDTQISNNMGNNTFLFYLPLAVFYEKSLVANERGEDYRAQRPLDSGHAYGLAIYMFKGVLSALRKLFLSDNRNISVFECLDNVLGSQPYVSIQPMVCNLRDIDPSLKTLRAERILSKTDDKTVGFKVMLPLNQKLFVVDGQHRREAMKIFFDFINFCISNGQIPASKNLLSPMKGELSRDIICLLEEVKIAANSSVTVQIECHIGLDVEQERQLFHDLNNLGKKVERSLALQFDNSNAVNLFIKKELIDDCSLINWELIEKDNTDWNTDTGAISRKDLVSINARLFLNSTNISKAKPAKIEERKEKAYEFWAAVGNIPYLGEPGAKLKTLAAQPVMLKAIAKLAYDFGFGRNANQQYFNILIDEIETFDFSHTNPVWRIFDLTPEQVDNYDLKELWDYLPNNKSVNREIGNYSEEDKTFRFSLKVNDVVPLIGDIIRWKLNLPNRNQAKIFSEE